MPIQYGQVFGQGVKYLKINRFDSGGLDRSGYLGQLTNLTINYDDLGPIQYNIVTTQEQSDYFVYGIQTRNQNTSSVNYKTLDYSLDVSKNNGFTLTNLKQYVGVINYTSENIDTLNNFNTSSGYYTFDITPNIPLSCSIRLNLTANSTNQDYFIYFSTDDFLNDNYDYSNAVTSSGTISAGTSQIINLNKILTFESNPIENSSYRLYIRKENSGGSLTLNNVSWLRITQSITPNSATSSLTIFNPEFINWDYNDYNALFGNAEIPQISNTYMDVDYTSTFTTPVNFDLIISGTADKALVQDSNYNSYTWSTIRYNGSRYNSFTSSNYTPQSKVEFARLNGNTTTNVGDFNDLSLDGSGYGALPAAEQNKTYIAYFDGIGGTGPEIIGQSAYFIKYLIDENGNTTNPEPGNIALLNLISSFEVGKKATALALGNTVATNLYGTHNITGVGRIAPILISETGSGVNDYAPSLNFTSIDPTSLFNITADYRFKATKNANQSIGDGDLIYAQNTILQVPSISSASYTGSTSSEYNFNSFTSNNNNRVNFSISGKIQVIYPQAQPGENTYGSAQFRISIFKDLNPIVSQYITSTYNGSTSQILNFNLETGLQSFSPGDKIRAGFFIENNTGGISITILQEDFQFSAINEINIAPLSVSSPYWSIGTYTTSSNQVSVLTSSLDLFTLYGDNFIQSASNNIKSFGFNNIILPFKPQVGDWIRFEYNPNKVFNVTKVETGEQNLYLTVNPSVPEGTQLSHFVLYRLINDGTYVILDVPKNQSGTFTGIIQPQYISQTMKDNYSDIIQDLTQKGLIS